MAAAAAPAGDSAMTIILTPLTRDMISHDLSSQVSQTAHQIIPAKWPCLLWIDSNSISKAGTGKQARRQSKRLRAESGRGSCKSLQCAMNDGRDGRTLYVTTTRLETR